jgi:hypothetical protein
MSLRPPSPFLIVLLLSIRAEKNKARTTLAIACLFFSNVLHHVTLSSNGVAVLAESDREPAINSYLEPLTRNYPNTENPKFEGALSTRRCSHFFSWALRVVLATS